MLIVLREGDVITTLEGSGHWKVNQAKCICKCGAEFKWLKELFEHWEKEHGQESTLDSIVRAK